MSRKRVKRRTPQPVTPREFMDDFKREAVEMLLDGHTAGSVADRLGLSPIACSRVVFLVAACKPIVTKQARWATRGSIPSQPTWPARLSVQDVSLSSWMDGFDSRAGHCRPLNTASPALFPVLRGI